MFCSRCNTPIEDGDHFCKNCGAALQAPQGIRRQPAIPASPAAPARPRNPGRAVSARPKNPYRDQIAQLRLQLRELRMQLQEVNSQIAGTRSNYFEIDSFVQRGPIHNIGRMVEGVQLFSPYQQRKQLQNQVIQLERELLSLEKAQEQWRQQQQQS
jgi:hypothetical protein